MKCNNCKKRMPKGAPFCTECNLYQSKRKHLPAIATWFSLLLASFAVVSGVLSAWTYLAERDSHTRFKVTSSDEHRVYLRVWNTGRKPSTLVGFRLVFDDMPNKETMFELSDKDQPEATNVIASGSPVKIGLSIPMTEAIPASRLGKQYTDKERSTMLVSRWIDRPLTLEVNVEESNDPCCFGFSWRPHHTRSEKFPAARISRFMTVTWRAGQNADKLQ